MENKSVNLAVLGVVGLLAVVGLVMMFNSGVTGQYVYANGIAQWEPNELCESLGGKLVGLEGGITMADRGPLLAICNINGQLVRAPITRPMDAQTEYFPQ